MFLNILESWDSFKKNGCLESEPTLKMNLTSWTFTSLLNLFTGPFSLALVIFEKLAIYSSIWVSVQDRGGHDIPIFP